MLPMRIREAVVTFDREKFHEVLCAYLSCIGAEREGNTDEHFRVIVDGENYDGLIASVFCNYEGASTEVLVMCNIDDQGVTHYAVLMRDGRTAPWIARQKSLSGPVGNRPVIGSYVLAEIEPPTH